ncbi:hypothetical protein FRC11_004214 [Ceratobasidium sp. 423]|nr:hypothetical protein FRC11_004214 [Ceratobasidium sp. 423]
MLRCDSYYYFPIFTTYRNDVPLTAESGVMEVAHIRDLYYSYADKHNNHLSPYSEWHPDPLERRIHQYPDVEVYTWTETAPQWFLGVDTCHALHGSYRHALQVFGDALQPSGWNRRQPWCDYDFSSELAKLGMPFIPKPLSFTEDPYHTPFETFEDLQSKVHHNNFYAMCLIATAIIVNAVKMNHFHNLAHSGYMRGSPGFVAAQRYWCRSNGHPVTDRSEDDESTADFELLAQEQEESSDALAPPPSLTINDAAKEEALQPTDESVRNHSDRRAGAFRRHFSNVGGDSFTAANIELLQSLRRGWDDIDSVSNVATTSSPPVVPSSIPDVDFNDLIERLTEIAVQQAIQAKSGSPELRHGLLQESTGERPKECYLGWEAYLNTQIGAIDDDYDMTNGD